MKKSSKAPQVPANQLYKIPRTPMSLDRTAMNRFYRSRLLNSLLAQLGLFMIFFVLWWFPLPNPIKLIVVLFHELSHVLAAYLTGGTVFGLAIDPAGAGITLGVGGNEIVIMAAGYVGSLFFGCVLYYLVGKWEPREVWALLCILCCLSIGFGWLNSFTPIFGYGILILMALGFFFLHAPGKGALCRLIATTCCLYPVIDVAGEYIHGGNQGFRIAAYEGGSDVAQLAYLTGIPELILAGVWILAGAAAMFFLIYWSARQEAKGEVKKNLFRFRKFPLWQVCEEEAGEGA